MIYYRVGKVAMKIELMVWKLVLVLPKLNLSNIFLYMYVFRITLKNYVLSNFKKEYLSIPPKNA